MPSDLWRRQQEKIYKVGFYGGAALMAPLTVLAAANRRIPTPLLLAALAILGVYGLLFFGYLGALIIGNLRQGVKETKAMRAGVLGHEEGSITGSGQKVDRPPSAHSQEGQPFWTYRRVLLLCGAVGITGSLMRIAGWWTS